MTWMSKVGPSSDLCRDTVLIHSRFGADQAWLELVNTERKVKAQGVVSCELFEIIMDRLEKEWFDLVSPARHIQLVVYSFRHADQE